jgi:hypothetical protein
MPMLDNPKHEAFCLFRVQGKTQDEAYKLAGFKPSRQNAHKLTTKDYIQARLKELRKGSAERAEVTTDTMADQFDEDRRNAIKWKQGSAAQAASVSKAKLYGLMTDKSSVTVTHNYNLMTEEELRFEIAALHAEARAIKAGVQQH